MNGGESLNYYINRNFSCGKCKEFEGSRVISIVGADLAEKGRLLELICDVFGSAKHDKYYSPCDRDLPNAVYLHDIDTLIVCGYAGVNADRIMSRTYDISSVLGCRAAPVEEIVGYTMNQSRSYMQKHLDLLGMSDYLLREYIKNGAELLYADRIRAYASRKMAQLLEKRRLGGASVYRSISAIGCEGYRFVSIPDKTEVWRLCDRLIAAERCFVRAAAAAANKLGWDAVISGAVDLEHSPLHLYIPEADLLFVSESPLLPERFSGSRKISLERFYDSRLTASREHYSDFFGEYIRRMFNESALYARICMDIRNQGRKLLAPYISERAVSEIASDIVRNILC